MTDISETAYPRLRADIGPKALADGYRPSNEEIEFARAQTTSPIRRVAMLIQLKVLQNIGYFPLLRDVPSAISDFVAVNAAFSRALSPEELSSCDGSSVRQPVLKALREYRGIRVFDKENHAWLRAKAEAAAESMYLTSDLINVLLEELVRHRFELPPFPLLDKLAQTGRNEVNDRYLDELGASISDAAKKQIDELFDVRSGMSTTSWQQLKREPKKPTRIETIEYVKHVRWLMALSRLLPALKMSIPKLRHLQEWAYREDAADMKKLRPNRRYALSAILIKSRLSKAFDDVGDLFVRLMANLENLAKKKLLDYQDEQQKEKDALIGQLSDMLSALLVEVSAPERIKAIERSLIDTPEALLARCKALLAYANRNHYPFLVESYDSPRSQLFNCLDVITIRSTTEDKSTERWVELLKSRLRHSKKATLELKELDISARSDFKWMADQMRELVLVKAEPRRAVTHANRKALEVAIFLLVKQELSSGDLYIEYGDEYRDWREEMVTPAEYADDIKEYSDIAGIETDGAKLVAQLKSEMTALALAIDQRWPENEHVKIVDGRPTVKRLSKQERPPEVKALDKMIGERMPEIGILECFSDVAKWLDLPRLFKPLSGKDTRIEDMHSRFVLTTVCFGCNLGPSQTERSTKRLSRKQVAWLNSRVVTEELIERANTEVVNAYAKFDLPKFWGGGTAVSVDGTKWDLYEQNLFSQMHIRYGGYGGLGYYVISDTYIALYSRFNTCGSHESNYMLDWFMANRSDIKPDTVHGDTHSQNYAGYALAYLLGIKLMPRIKGLGDYTFYRPSREVKFKNIGELFTDSVDWDLIETHLPDMLKVIFSLRRGKVTASTVLRRIGAHSRKNRLYAAFRELGAVVRTMFLLRYLDDLALRHAIHAAANKSEEFNAFVKWVFFGGEGTIAENIRSEQQKLVRYGMLAANMVMLHNVHHMTRVISDLMKEGVMVTAEIAEGLSPYRGKHINRFGFYDDEEYKTPEQMETKLSGIQPAKKKHEVA